MADSSPVYEDLNGLLNLPQNEIALVCFIQLPVVFTGQDVIKALVGSLNRKGSNVFREDNFACWGIVRNGYAKNRCSR